MAARTLSLSNTGPHRIRALIEHGPSSNTGLTPPPKESPMTRFASLAIATVLCAAAALPMLSKAAMIVA